jgi:hypothetical protein
MTPTPSNRLASTKKRGRPPMFSEIPMLPDDTPPPSRAGDAESVIDYGERCPCGKHPSWLRVREGVKIITDDTSTLRQCICLGCGRKVAVRSLIKRK